MASLLLFDYQFWDCTVAWSRIDWAVEMIYVLSTDKVWPAGDITVAPVIKRERPSAELLWRTNDLKAERSWRVCQFMTSLQNCMENLSSVKKIDRVESYLEAELLSILCVPRSISFWIFGEAIVPYYLHIILMKSQFFPIGTVPASQDAPVHGPSVADIKKPLGHRMLVWWWW